jgi:hypothetical protein
MVAIPQRLGAQRCGIRPGGRFGQAVARHQIEAGEGREPALALFGRTILVDHPACHGVNGQHGGMADAAARQLLEHQGCFHPAKSGAANVVADIDTGEAELGCGLEHVPVQPLFFFPAQRMGGKLIAGELPCSVLDEFLVFGQSELAHRITPSSG